MCEEPFQFYANNLSLSLSLYIYIYIYIEREREREREGSVMNSAKNIICEQRRNSAFSIFAVGFHLDRLSSNDRKLSLPYYFTSSWKKKR